MEQQLSEQAYDIKTISDNVDFIHFMGYDYTAATSNVTGLLAPLTPIKQSVTYWLDNGLPANKLVLGMPTYARYFILKNATNHGIGDSLSEEKESGPYTNEKGFLSYYELQMFFIGTDCKTNIKMNDSTRYTYCDDQWYSFDDEKSLKLKSQYILDNNLGGAMIWSLDTDDFRGTYGPKYPLLSTIYNYLLNEN